MRTIYFISLFSIQLAISIRYREQAAKDAEHVYRHAQHILKDRGWPDDLINENDVKLFCKHAAELRLIRGTSLGSELSAKQLSTEIDISKRFFTFKKLSLSLTFLFQVSNWKSRTVLGFSTCF